MKRNSQRSESVKIREREIIIMEEKWGEKIVALNREHILNRNAWIEKVKTQSSNK